MIFSACRLGSNFCDPRYRGMSLAPERLRDTLAFMIEDAWPAVMGPDIPAPTMQELMDYQAQSGKFASSKAWILPGLKPHSYWALFPDLSLPVQLFCGTKILLFVLTIFFTKCTKASLCKLIG